MTLTSGILANGSGSANFAIANPINFNNSVVTLSTTNRIFFTGPISVTGNNQFQVTLPTFFSGVVSGSGSVNVFAGAGVLVMQNANNTYSGGTNLGGGALQVNSSDNGTLTSAPTAGPLGTGAINLTGGTFENANPALDAEYAANVVTLHNVVNLLNAGRPP